MSGSENYLCPKCSERDLRPCFDGGVFHLRCHRCAGNYFIDEFDLEQFVKSKVGREASRVYVRWLLLSMENADTSRFGRRVCPLCQARLRHHPFGREPFFVVLDRCELHGLWCDKEEVDTVLKGCQQEAQ